MQVYRLSPDNKLPLHWCYSEAWDLNQIPIQTGEDEFEVETELVDHRAEGAQVWSSLASVVAATFWHNDGDYGPDDGYGLLLILETKGELEDSAGEWFAATQE